ncbi:MAG: UDP-galactopyranose mutase [Thermoguttaceae bacterium]|nr:UDP-galactopyranose mutase [Thermoguttaceae bacterium]
MFENLRYLVVGAGITGSVIAERIAAVLGERVLLIDKRPHTGGNCHSSIDPETGIETHMYGSHIFHTSIEKVWEYISRFSAFTSYRHKVLIRCGGKTFFMPINLKTLIDFFGRNFSPDQARELMAQERDAFTHPRNLEEKAISLIGRPLYETFIAGYTQKQWGRSPQDLPADIITRLPVRTNFNTDYFNDPHQGVPKDGYFTLFDRLLSHPKIEVRTGTDFRSIRDQVPASCLVVYTGMIDEYFDHRLGALDWRSLSFEWETLPTSDFQGTTVMNYGDVDVPFTRIHEFKHYHPERREPFELEKTVICREYPAQYVPGREAYYPVNNTRNQELLAGYQKLAKQNTSLLFCGRLGSYCYWDMDKAIESALDLFEREILPRAGKGSAK